MCEIKVYQKMQTCLSFYLDKESKQKIYDLYVVNTDNKQNYDNTSCISCRKSMDYMMYVIF